MSALAGQHQVEDDGVIAALGGEELAFEAVGGVIDGEAAAVAEGGGEVFRETYLIFDDQNTHGSVSC